jgi:hypothetical protein
MNKTYYEKNKDKILSKLKEKRKNKTKEEIEKEKEYQRNYWVNIRKKRLQEEFNRTGTHYIKEYYKNNIKPFYLSKKENPKLEKKEENTIISFD